MTMNFDKLHKKLRMGDTLSNDELTFLNLRAKNITTALNGAGDVFYTAFKEANRICIDTESYLEARKES